MKTGRRAGMSLAAAEAVYEAVLSGHVTITMGKETIHAKVVTVQNKYLVTLPGASYSCEGDTLDDAVATALSQAADLYSILAIEALPYQPKPTT